MSDTQINQEYNLYLKHTEIPLKYQSQDNYDDIQNILLIKDDVHQKNKLYQATNQNTLPVIYYEYSTKQELNELISKIPNLKRIAIAFHDAYLNQNETFLDNQPLFTQQDLSQSDKELYSDNLKFFIQLKDFNIENLDFLVCNSLNYDTWKLFYQIIQNEIGIVIGASNDKTGNLKYGGDWELENTQEIIKNIYFSDLIENYSSTLDTTIINTNTDITQSLIVSYNFPVIINGGTQENPITINFTENLNLQASQYFIIQSEYITIDGQYNIVNFTLNNSEIESNTDGLIRNGTLGVNGFSNIIIKNIGITNDINVNLSSEDSWLCQSYFGRGISSGNIVIENCYSTGDITRRDCGGIVGESLGYFMTGGSINIQNCYTTGNITGQGVGGIAGANLGLDMSGGSIIIQNCYATVNISAENAGGIVSKNVGFRMSGGSINIQNCYSTGEISGEASGGIAGAVLGLLMSNGSITIQKCYATGEITGEDAGGITGRNLGNNKTNGSINIQNNIYNDSGNDKPLIGSISRNRNLTIINNNTQPNNTWSDENALNTIFLNNIWGTTYSKNIITNNKRWFLLSNIENNINLLFIIGKDNSGNLIFIPITDEPIQKIILIRIN